MSGAHTAKKVDAGAHGAESAHADTHKKPELKAIPGGKETEKTPHGAVDAIKDATHAAVAKKAPEAHEKPRDAHAPKDSHAAPDAHHATAHAPAEKSHDDAHAAPSHAASAHGDEKKEEPKGLKKLWVKMKGWWKTLKDLLS